MEKETGAVYYCRVREHPLGGESNLARKMLKYAFLDFFHRDFQEEEIGRLENGKPYYRKDERLHFNISHCKSAVAAAVSYYPIGIDVESVRKVKERTVKKCCGKEEISYVFDGRANAQNEAGVLSEAETERFLKLWTLKESCVKMTGEGLQKPLNEVCFWPETMEETGENGVFRIKGNIPLATHYLYLPKELSLALTVKWTPLNAGPKFVWKEHASEKLI